MSGGPERWQALRLVWIDAALSAATGLRRCDLQAVFGVSIPTASADLARFAVLFPGRMAYDPRRKTHFAVPGTGPVFPDGLRRAAVRAGPSAPAATVTGAAA
jgi:hypothetical protein